MSVHGHDVLHLIIDEEPSPEQLRARCAELFGADAVYHTCSAEDMDLEGLLQFLRAREKIAEVDGRITADPAKMCNHAD